MTSFNVDCHPAFYTWPTIERNIQGTVDRVRKVILAREVCSSPSMGKDQCRDALVTTWTGRAHWYWRAMDVPGRGRCGHPGRLPATWCRAVKGVWWLSRVPPWAGRVHWVKDASTTLPSSGAEDPRIYCGRQVQRAHTLLKAERLAQSLNLSFTCCE